MAVTPRTMEVELSWKGKTGRALALTVAGDTSGSWKEDNETHDQYTQRVLDRAEAFHEWVETGVRLQSQVDMLEDFFRHLMKVGTINRESWMTASAIDQIIQGFVTPPSFEAPDDEVGNKVDDIVVDDDDSDEDVPAIRKEHNQCGHCSEDIERSEGYPWIHTNQTAYLGYVRINGEHAATPANVSN